MCIVEDILVGMMAGVEFFFPVGANVTDLIIAKGNAETISRFQIQISKAKNKVIVDGVIIIVEQCRDTATSRS